MNDLSDGLKDRLKDRITIVTMQLDFGPQASEARGARTRTWSPSRGAELSNEDVAKDVAVRSSWPHVVDPNNPDDRSGWNVQLNAPSGVDPGTVTLYAGCAG